MCNQNAECITNKEVSSYSCQCKKLLIGGEIVLGVGDGVGDRGCIYHYPQNEIQDNVEMWPIEGTQIPIHIPPLVPSSSTESSSSNSSSSSSSSISNSTTQNHNHLTSSTTITEDSFRALENFSVHHTGI